MGYTTTFNGEFDVTPPLDEETIELVNGLVNTRRMKRDLTLIMSQEEAEKYGVQGEFYIKGEGYMGQGHDPSVLDHNYPPITQPGLWCKWEYYPESNTIAWNGADKFYYYIEWIQYLIREILEPLGHRVNGEVNWSGEEPGDLGKIRITDNYVEELQATITYERR